MGYPVKRITCTMFLVYGLSILDCSFGFQIFFFIFISYVQLNDDNVHVKDYSLANQKYGSENKILARYLYTALSNKLYIVPFVTVPEMKI